jgi:hypothetical protein
MVLHNRIIRSAEIMIKKLTLPALVLITAMLLTSCGGSSDEEIRESLTPNTLTDVGVCTAVVNDQCPEDMAVIPRDTPKIYVAGRLKNATVGTMVNASLRNLEGEEPLDLVNTQLAINAVNVNLESFPVFYFTNTDPWTTGKYSVKIQVQGGGQEPVYKDFSVE